MEMTRVHAGKLRAIGYDASKRILRVELEDGSAWEYDNVGANVWRTLHGAGAQWSYYRDHIEEEFTARRVSTQAATQGKNPLDDLFG